MLRRDRCWHPTSCGDEVRGDECERSRLAAIRRRSPTDDALSRVRRPLSVWGFRGLSSSDEDEDEEGGVRLRCRRSCSCRARPLSRSRSRSRRRSRWRLRDGLREALPLRERSTFGACLIASAGSSRSAPLSAPRALLSSRECSRSARPVSPSRLYSRLCLLVLVLVCGDLLGEDGEREEGRRVLTATGRESGAEGCVEGRAVGGTTPRRFWSS